MCVRKGKKKCSLWSYAKKITVMSRLEEVRLYWPGKHPAGCLFYKAVVLMDKLSEKSFLLGIIQKGMTMIYPTPCTWHDRSRLQSSGMVEVKNLSCQNTYHGNSDRVTRRFACVKEVIGSKLIHHPQVCVNAFWIYQDGYVSIGQFQSRYDSNTPFSVL